jgi:hypothetical protein
VAGREFDEHDYLWYSIPGIEFLDEEERERAINLFEEFLDDATHYHERPQDSLAWQEFMEMFGLDEGDFPWEEFREWYDAQ